ncbi:hypothetical protein P7C73_g524, partial [Tremellales sp. Uapishka_1]
MSFELTAHDAAIANLSSVIGSGISLSMCTFVLAASLTIWSVKSARPTLDRLSFRLLLWSMVFEIAYDICFIYLGYGVLNYNRPRCITSMYFVFAFLGVVNYLCTSIAVNLMLTITFGLNTCELGLEKWYIGVSIALGMFIPLIPACLGHFGLDPLYDVCWIATNDDDTRLKYFVLDLYLWQILSCAIAAASVLITLSTLFRSGRATSRVLFKGNQLNQDVLPRRSALDYLKSILTRRNRDSNTVELKVSRMGTLQDRFFKIALKIAMYPISLIVVNVIISGKL